MVRGPSDVIRLHVDPARLAEAEVVASDEDHKYLTRVLRLAVGDGITLFDGEGREADAVIARIGPRAVELRVTERREAPARVGPELVLVQALARGEKLDLVVQKSTELGVHRIVPVSTERAVPRVEEERGEARLLRWRKIAREAARQCGRADLPRIEPLTTFAAAVAAQPVDAMKLVFWEQARARHLRSIFAEHLGDSTVTPTPVPAPPTIVIAVGPEGGFSDEEVSIARASGFQVAGLGPRILRTETAAFTALAVIGYVFGDLG